MAGIVTAISAAIAFFGLAIAMFNLAHRQGRLLGKIEEQLDDHSEDIDSLWEANRDQTEEIKDVVSKVDALEPMVAVIHKQVNEIYKTYLNKGIGSENK